MVNKKDCCGCTACQHICPINCITMKEDDEGFLYPLIEESMCIHCNKCNNVCPINNIDNSNLESKTYVGYNKDEFIRKQSSSGGIFSAVAELVLHHEGVVIGAAYDENFEVHHIVIESKSELEKLRGSKYVQSRLDNIFTEVKHHLEMKRIVLFTGTACQIAGLKNYLNKQYDTLYTVDVLCHGVPSPKIWRMYLKEKEKEYKAKIEQIEFRNKDNGWKNFNLKIIFSNMQCYSTYFFEDNFMKMFLGNIDLRPSCYECHFKDFPRVSDMTIGDCWGIESTMPDMDDDNGTSIIVVHSSNGEKLMDEIRRGLLLKETRLDDVLPWTAESRRSVTQHANRQKYLKGLQRGEHIEELYEYVHLSFVQRVLGYIGYRIFRKKGRGK